MKKCQRSTLCKESPPAWHAGFERVIPIIEAHAKFSFRRLAPEAREEAVQQTICLVCQAYVRLV
jgi:hypothetical protein